MNITVMLPPRRPATRCIATNPDTGELCAEATGVHLGFEMLCEEHYQYLFQRARKDVMSELEHTDSEEIHRRRYAEFYARTRRGWKLSDEETADLVGQQHAAAAETTLDVRQWLERGSAGKPTASKVYFLRHGDQIKIGTSVDVPGRARELSFSPDAVLATEPGGRRRERELHDYWAPVRAQGEWFWAVPALLAYIEQLNAAEPASA